MATPVVGRPSRPERLTAVSAPWQGASQFSTYDRKLGYCPRMTSSDAKSDPSELGPRRQRILAVIREWVELHGYPPTVREIGAVVGLGSPSSVAHHLTVFQRRGLLRRACGPARSRPPVAQCRQTRRYGRGGVSVSRCWDYRRRRPDPRRGTRRGGLDASGRAVGHGTLFALYVQGSRRSRPASLTAMSSSCGSRR